VSRGHDIDDAGMGLGRLHVEKGHSDRALCLLNGPERHGASRADGYPLAYRASPVTFQTPSRRVSRLSDIRACRMWAGAWAEFGQSLDKLISGVMQGSGNGCERGGRKSRNALWRSRCGECQGARQDPLRELDLELVVAGGFSRRPAPPFAARWNASDPGLEPFQNFLG